jgi:ribonucleoside-diphosphate reductase alpha chain
VTTAQAAASVRVEGGDREGDGGDGNMGRSAIAATRPERSTGRVKPPGQGLAVERYFTTPGVHPYDQVEWDLRVAAITGDGGKVYFEQRDVEVPSSWSQTAVNVVVHKYFRGVLGSATRERSVKQLIARVVNTITQWGINDGFFATPEDAETYRAELTHLLVEQKMAFNSPVWFNVGVEEHPQCSACFINSVDDTMEGILTLAKTEGMLFKWGSGTGTNFSTLRSSRELLNGGGTASGPVSFMKGFDAFAGVIKSGGKTRRAAKMVILNADHPDIVDFIWCKAGEERKAWALIDAGFDGGFNVPGGAYDSISYQNANHSVRVTDEFMQAAVADREWRTHAVSKTGTTGATIDTYRAKDLFHQLSEAAHQCGDPGMQFDTTINGWHTCPETARINASNPCSEYMFLDDSACNLASINLMKFESAEGTFDVEGFKRAVELTLLAQEIIVDNAKYPTEQIAANSHAYRPLGLGYANLGALLMSRGLPYDSDAGRSVAGAITAVMTGWAYATSAKISRDVTGPFAGYEKNRQPFIGVMEKHRRHVDQVDSAYVPYDLMEAARATWDEAIRIGREHGFRNAQATVLAPTGTIGFMMDCDTTGIEPDIALVKYKRLVGGGMMKIVNQTVPAALRTLGYDESEVNAIIEYIDQNETIEGAPGLRDEHLAVFDCAFRAQSGTRSIHYMGHVRMMAAAQPFLSGAISKTVNLPNDCSIEDIEDAYLEAWRLGLKAIAVYRDGCKRTQPLSTGKSAVAKASAELAAAVVEVNGPPKAVRRKLPEERQSITHKFSIAGHEGYIHVGMYEDGSPGEIFIRMAKQGSTISGLMDSFATAVSLALQHGVPLRLMADKFRGTKFDPSGFTGNPEVPRATSIMDYIFRWLSAKFLKDELAEQLDLPGATSRASSTGKAGGGGTSGSGAVGGGFGGAGSPGGASSSGSKARPSQGPVVVDMTGGAEVRAEGRGEPAGYSSTFVTSSDAPPCIDCGHIMVRNGACYKCLNCGTTSGCS